MFRVGFIVPSIRTPVFSWCRVWTRIDGMTAPTLDLQTFLLQVLSTVYLRRITRYPKQFMSTCLNDASRRTYICINIIARVGVLP